MVIKSELFLTDKVSIALHARLYRFSFGHYYITIHKEYTQKV